MAGISQHIPNYIKGISRQPDELKTPGQVRDAKNCIPDVTNGLMKRPGARLVNPLGFGQDGLIDPDDIDYVPGSAKQGKWFDLYVSKEESYIGQINKDGRVEIWSTSDGLPRTVKYSPLAEDFSSPADGVTAQPSCDSEAFAAARDAYRTIENNINELEVEIDYNQTNLNNTKVDNNDGTRAEYTIEIVEGERYYVVERGYIVRVPDYNGQDEDETIINRPDNYDGKAGRRARGVKCITTGSYKNYLEGNIYSGPEWESSEEGVVAKDRVIWDEEYIFDGDPCDIYDFKIDNSSDAIIVNKDQEQINADKEALAVLDGQRAEALQTFAGVASSCGNVQLPNSRLFKQAREEEPINTIPYLQFVFPGDLQTLSVQERVLVVNRTVPVTMSKDISTVRYPEGYVEVTGVAGARVYSFRVDVKDVEAGFSKMRASKLIIAKSPKNGKTPCDKDGTKLFENISQGNGKNLVFELNTRSSQLPVDNDKPEKGYKCKYTSDLILQNGGEGWKKGDLIEVEMSGEK